MSTLRKDLLHAIEKEHNRITLFGNGDTDKQEKLGRCIEKLKKACDEPEKWSVQLLINSIDAAPPCRSENLNEGAKGSNHG